MHQNNFSYSINYYRIVSVDNDQNKTYSDIKSIKSPISDIRIFPNPVGAELTVQFPDAWVDKNVQVELINTVGQVVVSTMITAATAFETISLNDNTMHPGYYILRLSNEEGVFTQSIMKE